MQTITLTGASNISRSADVYTSKSGLDVGSTYYKFFCTSCQANLGRYYLTTSKDLDDLREKFTFTIDSIKSYELGKNKIGKGLEEVMGIVPSKSRGQAPSQSQSQAQSPKPHQDDSIRTSSDSSEMNKESVVPPVPVPAVTLGHVNGEVMKVQHVMMDLLQRVAAQEQSIQYVLSVLAAYSISTDTGTGTDTGLAVGSGVGSGNGEPSWMIPNEDSATTADLRYTEAQVYTHVVDRDRDRDGDRIHQGGNRNTISFPQNHNSPLPPHLPARQHEPPLRRPLQQHQQQQYQYQHNQGSQQRPHNPPQRKKPRP